MRTILRCILPIWSIFTRNSWFASNSSNSSLSLSTWRACRSGWAIISCFAFTDNRLCSSITIIGVNVRA
uniref:Candidate secreted effector n=1 Tax=Meloidogyne incognita TaxID=6306 RepID=A0A914KQH0_MELIC